MNNRETSTSVGIVIALGFIVLGILNLFASTFYHRTSLNSLSLLPGILFITVGVVIIIIKMIKQPKE